MIFLQARQNKRIGPQSLHRGSVPEVAAQGAWQPGEATRSEVSEPHRQRRSAHQCAQRSPEKVRPSDEARGHHQEVEYAQAEEARTCIDLSVAALGPHQPFQIVLTMVSRFMSNTPASAT